MNRTLSPISPILLTAILVALTLTVSDAADPRDLRSKDDAPDATIQRDSAVSFDWPIAEHLDQWLRDACDYVSAFLKRWPQEQSASKESIAKSLKTIRQVLSHTPNVLVLSPAHHACKRAERALMLNDIPNARWEIDLASHYIEIYGSLFPAPLRLVYQTDALSPEDGRTREQDSRSVVKSGRVF